MSFFSVLKEVVAKVGVDLLRQASKSSSKKTSASSSGSRKSSTSKRNTPLTKGTETVRKPSRDDAGGSWLPGPNDEPVVWDVDKRGLPDFDYRPDSDKAPDPGEVVWTWVPYEENDGRGKDRPVLVLAEEGNCVIFGQMTSKDHDRDASQEARWGRYWIDLGSGNWDSKGRPSELRLDRLLIVHEDQVRRQGGHVEPEVFAEVLRALKALHS